MTFAVKNETNPFPLSWCLCHAHNLYDAIPEAYCKYRYYYYAVFHAATPDVV